jgi:hypothetical protein
MIDRLLVGSVVVGVVAAAFIGGRISVRPNDAKLRDSLAVWRADNMRLRHQNDSLSRDDKAAQIEKLAADSLAAYWHGRFVAKVAVAADTEAAANAAHAALAQAKTCADSNAVLVREVGLRQSECAILKAANADLSRSFAEQQTGRAQAERQLADVRLAKTNDSTQLDRAQGIIRKLEKSGRWCTLPLIGIPCPTPGADFSTTRGAFAVNVGMQVKSWLRLSVSREIYRP